MMIQNTERAPDSGNALDRKTSRTNQGSNQEKIGYLIPEFPGQTHIWIWREISHMREWGVQIKVFSTKRPAEDIRARHAFANSAQAETYYLWPQSPFRLLVTLLWVLFTRPLGLGKAIWLALTLDVEERPQWRSTLPLVLPACILAREACAQGIDHLHCHSCANSAILAMMLKRLNGIPYSLSLNANLEWWGGAMTEKLTEAKFTMAVTEQLLDQIRREYPHLRQNQALLGHTGVDTTKWIPVAKGSKKEHEVFQAITVGRLHHSKGHDLLIRSIKRLVDAGQAIKLTVVGAGPERENLETLVSQLDLCQVVQFTGSLSEDQIIERMKQSDVFVLASHAEPLGVVYMEAMAMEVPTIGTDAGGVPEIISTSHNGLLVPPGDEKALAEAIESLMKNPELRHKLARNGRRTVIQRFDSRISAATLHQQLLGSLPKGYQQPLSTTPPYSTSS
jgi:glycosyltransferase involved in cell wall biosynthesis